MIMDVEVYYGEERRGCGYRKISKENKVFYYLCGSGISAPCDRLPFKLNVCPVCGNGLKFHRGFQWIDWHRYAGDHNECECDEYCYICHPTDEKYGLMWVGERFYSPQSFVREAEKLGISKLVPSLPKNLEIGRTKVLLAHRKAWKNKEPAIFYAFIVRRVEVLVRVEDLSKEWVKRLRKRGVVVIAAYKEQKQKQMKIGGD